MWRYQYRAWGQPAPAVVVPAVEEYVKWKPGMENEIRWAQLKRVDKAINKLTRVYAEDVSKLVDVCRQVIVFEKVQDMVACLDAIDEDPQCRVLRVKNRMQVWSDATESGGFRNVVLSLNITSREPVRYGLENHVCEVQLVLKPFAEAATAERHERYVKFRYHHRPVAVTFQRLQSLVPTQSIRGANRRTAMTGERASPLPLRLFSTAAQVAPDPSPEDRSDPGLEHLTIKETVALQRTTVEGGYLDKVLKSGYSLKSASSGSVLFTAKPIETSMCYWQWQTLLLVYAVMVYVACFGIWDKWKSADFAPPYQHFRFTNIENRMGTTRPPAVGIQSFGVMKNGCLSVEKVDSVSKGDGVMTVKYWRPVEMNGFYFVTDYANSSTDFDPVKFEVHGSMDEQTWDRVGSSFFRIQDNGNRKLLDGKYKTPKLRDFNVKFNMELPWAWVLSMTGHVPWAFALTIIAISGLFLITRGATVVFAVGMASSFLVHFTASIAWYYTGFWQEGVASLLFAGGVFGTMVLAVRWPARLVRSLASIGVSFCLIDVFRHGILYSDISGMAYNPPITGIILTISGLVAIWLRRRIVATAKRIVEQDLAEYSKLWAEVEGRPGAVEELEALEQLAARMAAVQHRVRHLCRVDRRLGPGSHDLSKDFETDSLSLGSECHVHDKSLTMSLEWSAGGGRTPSHSPMRAMVPVTSLDQVYSQAALIQPMLRTKVQEWAQASDGLFPRAKHAFFGFRGGALRSFHGWEGSLSRTEMTKGSYVKWAEMYANPESESLVQWASIKRVERSVEKLTRVYGEDVSRLVDVCRQSVVFESIGSLRHCLDAIHNDPGVLVVRVKNRLSRKFNAAESAGFRNVALNLLIVTPEAAELGVDTHVCEVQLLLRDFMDAKSNEGHKRYVRFRNLRGE